MGHKNLVGVSDTRFDWFVASRSELLELAVVLGAFAEAGWRSWSNTPTYPISVPDYSLFDDVAKG